MNRRVDGRDAPCGTPPIRGVPARLLPTGARRRRTGRVAIDEPPQPVLGAPLDLQHARHRQPHGHGGAPHRQPPDEPQGEHLAVARRQRQQAAPDLRPQVGLERQRFGVVGVVGEHGSLLQLDKLHGGRAAGHSQGAAGRAWQEIPRPQTVVDRSTDPVAGVGAEPHATVWGS